MHADPIRTARKAEQLDAAASPDAVHRGGSGLDEVRLRHRALPGRDLAQVDLAANLLGRRLGAPVIVSAMTGGSEASRVVNVELLEAATEHGAAMILGSSRALVDEPGLVGTYRPCAARPPLLLANLGASHLVQGLTADQALRVVELLDADGLALYLNPLPEAVQPEGHPELGGAIELIADLVERLAPLPVLVKEIGFGLDPDDVALLADAGVAAVDVAGAGGTNWALVEGLRDDDARALAAPFSTWGTPTAEALRDAVRVAGLRVPVIASGGVRDGVDVARCLALGASAAGIARPMLLAARAGTAQASLGTLVEQLRVATWCAGAAAARDLGPEHLRPTA
ncbi:MAG: type 2 isopentenyl-diphosphate Delta-isomerase [Actinomycetota bacterium]